MADEQFGGADLDHMREFKVHVPLRLHLRLHQHRLLTGTSLSNTMEMALAQYFEKHLPQDNQAN